MTSTIYAKERHRSRYCTKSSQGRAVSTYCKDKVKLNVLQFFIRRDWRCIFHNEGKYSVDLDFSSVEQSCNFYSCIVGFITPCLSDYRYIADVRCHLAALL